LLRRMFLPWFLLEWHQGRMEEARLIQSRVSSGTTEHAAMAFLLDDAISLDQLLASLPPDANALGWFVAGERELKAARPEAAAQFYRSCVDAGGNGWFRSSAQARLNQLEADSAPEVSP
jgi:predicted TPR repeat methyltransferase